MANISDTVTIISLLSDNKCFKLKRDDLFKNGESITCFELKDIPDSKDSKKKWELVFELKIESEPIQLFVDYINEGRIPSEESKMGNLLNIFGMFKIPKTRIRDKWNRRNENLPKLKGRLGDLKSKNYVGFSLIFLDVDSITRTPSRNITPPLDNTSTSHNELNFFPIRHTRWHRGIAKYGNSVIIAGGQNTHGSRECSNEVDMYTFNDRTIEHKSLPPMQEKRYKFTLVTFNNYVYAVGGENPKDNKRIRTVERWNDEENTWSFVAPMFEGLCSCASHAVAVNNRIYVLDDKESMYYDPEENQWHIIPLSYGHKIEWGITNAVVADDRYIYILNCSKNIFCRYDAVEGNWENTKVEQLTLMEYTHKYFVLLRKDIYLYAFPIFPHSANSDNQASKKMYRFNTKEKIWTEMGIMGHCMSEIGGILLFD